MKIKFCFLSAVLVMGLCLAGCMSSGLAASGGNKTSGYTEKVEETEEVEETDPEKLFVFEIRGDTAVIKKYKGRMRDLVIPAEIQGKPVTEIGKDAFYHLRYLTSVIIPDSVITIGDNAFYGDELTSVTIPDSVITIGESAFRENKLTSVIISKSATIIGEGAFSDNKLTSVLIPDSVTTIGDYAFNRNQLTSVTIPDSVITIGYSAFDHNELTSVIIPDSVTFIGSFAFFSNKLTSITISAPGAAIGVSAFRDNLLTSITISAPGAVIGRDAFKNNPLTSITISDNVTDYYEDTELLHLFVHYRAYGKKGGVYTFQGTQWYFNGKPLPVGSILKRDKDTYISTIDDMDSVQYQWDSGIYYLKPGKHSITLGYSSGNYHSEGSLSFSYMFEEGNTYRAVSMFINNRVGFDIIQEK